MATTKIYPHSTTDLNYVYQTSGTYPNVTISSGGTSSSSILWNGTGISPPTYTTGNPVTVNKDGKISLYGQDADLDINGKSLKTWMEKVEQRLNILTPNPELEKDWEELQKLGEKYRELEKRCQEKADVWNKLKASEPQTKP